MSKYYVFLHIANRVERRAKRSHHYFSFGQRQSVVLLNAKTNGDVFDCYCDDNDHDSAPGVGRVLLLESTPHVPLRRKVV